MRANFSVFPFSIVILATPAFAALDYSLIGSTYTQSFDGLASDEQNNPHAWANDSTIEGWNLFRITSKDNSTPVAVNSLDASDGTSDSGRFYSFGAAGSGERALGAVGHTIFAGLDSSSGPGFGQTAGWIAASITNNTGVVLTQFTFAYDGEQWRDAGNDPPTAQTMEFEYGFGSSFAGVSSWAMPSGTFDFTSPVFTASSGPVDGNTAGRVANLGGLISNLTWEDGDTLWMRWIERNDSGTDHGLAIDNFSFAASTSAVPEASIVVFGSLVCAVIGVVHAGRKLLRRAAA
jgi:hypothetical protein